MVSICAGRVLHLSKDGDAIAPGARSGIGSCGRFYLPFFFFFSLFPVPSKGFGSRLFADLNARGNLVVLQFGDGWERLLSGIRDICLVNGAKDHKVSAPTKGISDCKLPLCA
jgi:hypothetical protein